MASQVVLPHGTYPAGTQKLGPADVPDGLVGFTLSLDRSEWLSVSVKLAITVELSLDNGATWNPHPEADPYPVGLTAEGGVKVDKFGVTVAATTLSAPLPEPQNQNRKIKATIVITGGPLTTTGTLNLV